MLTDVGLRAMKRTSIDTRTAGGAAWPTYGRHRRRRGLVMLKPLLVWRLVRA